MRKIKRPKLGQYVLVASWRGFDLNNPWAIGFLREIIESDTGFRYRIQGTNRYWKAVYKITVEEGTELIDFAKKSDNFQPFGGV